MKRFSLVLLLLLYVFGILFLHEMPTGDLKVNKMMIGPVNVDLLLHLGMFLPWGYLGLPYVYRRPAGCFLRGCVWVGLGLLLALGAEGTQLFLSYRSFSLRDLGCNFAGVLLGSLAFVIWRQRRNSDSVYCRI